MSQIENPYEWDNPDSWLYIPKFGVKPSEVNFDGFRCPVFEPGMSHDFVNDIMCLIRTARKLVQIDFKNIGDLNNSYLEGLDDLENPNAVLGQRKRVAVLYNIFIHYIERAVSSRASSNEKIEAMASASSLLVSWATDGSEAALKRISKTQADRRIGKTKLTESQKKQVVREYEAASVTYGTIKLLAGKFDVSTDTISRIVSTKPIQKETNQD